MSYLSLECGGLAFVQDSRGNFNTKVFKIICGAAKIVQGYFTDKHEWD